MSEFQTTKKRRLIKQISTAVIFPIVIVGGWFYPLLGYFIPICMIAGITIAFSRGRKWCDWYCPRGSFFDAAIMRISPNKQIPAAFKGLPTRITMLTVLMSVITVQIIRFWPDPYKIGKAFVVLLTVTTGIALVLAIIYHPRVWCCFCPIGSISNWVGKGKRPVKIDSSLCNECKLCGKVCPIQVLPYKYKDKSVKNVIDGDCLKCGLCTVACPQKALKL